MKLSHIISLATTAWMGSTAQAFVVTPPSSSSSLLLSSIFQSSIGSTTRRPAASKEAWDIDGDEPTEEDIERLYDQVDELSLKRALDPTEKAWRYATKVLLRIGSKGATLTHGNSLRQLLEQHEVVKVKINTRKFGGLEDAFLVLRDLAVEAGAPQGIELIQSRDIENTILFGRPGTMAAIQSGTFPPPEVVWVPRPKEDRKQKPEEFSSNP